jgi:DNA-binding response OmpR family regulator
MQSPCRPPPARPPRILCVDDEAGALLIRKALLEGAGYAVLTALNASEGLKIFKSCKIDAVISDHLLPDVPGTEMARQMKLTKPGVPILLLSGITDLPSGAEHADKFLTKTEGPENLLKELAELLRYRRVHVSDGAYCAEIACDTFASSAVWHCLIQQVGSSEILSWSQSATEKLAVAGAKKQLSSLNMKHRAPTKGS